MVSGRCGRWQQGLEVARRSEDLEAWRSGDVDGLEVWRSGGMEVWKGVDIWRRGGLETWRVWRSGGSENV
jgi:hypothetical protein